MKSNRIVNKLLPPQSRRRNLVKAVLIHQKTRSFTPNPNYSQWIKDIEPPLFDSTIKVERGPLISIVVPCYNTPLKYFYPLLESVRSQTYANWQLCIVDGSNDKLSSENIKELCSNDKRIVYKKINKNLGISRNTNEAISMAGGQYIALLDHDDTISPHALNELASVIKNKPDTDIIYSDEDKLSEDGKERVLPFFKPDWSPELLLGVNYITHFLVVRSKLLIQVGNLRPQFDGAQDYDLMLRLSEVSNKIVHIPKVLYHWRLAEGSTAKVVSEKDYATIAGREALQEALNRRQLAAKALEVQSHPTNYRPKYSLNSKPPLVSIIIPFKDKVKLLKQCLPSILEKSTYQNYETILISNNSTEDATFRYLEEIKKESRCKVYIWNHQFNYSAINNYGRKQASGEYLVFLNNDTEIITPQWLEELVGVASQKDIGAVGPLLLYPNHRIQHAGVVLGMGGMAGHVFRSRKEGEWTDFGLTTWPRNYLAVTGACLTLKTEKFDEAGGFDERLRIGGNDIALCLSLYKKGWRNVFWPFVQLIHYENMSVGPYDKNVPIEDYNQSLKYYKPFLDKGDPYFNPNLSLDDEAVSLRGMS
ncbi:MAG TPA: glycosyltransferase family 2 protein [Candidatus Saccharimonadales bacterium]|nr:glycosyltransferase family 2 protein [Candidatus Saccharimonadales bacterium]